MALIFVGGSFVQTAIGFGLAIVAAPLLFLVSLRLCTRAYLSLLACSFLIFTCLNTEQNISIGGLKIALLGRIPGSIAGGALLGDGFNERIVTVVRFIGGVCGDCQLASV